MDVEPDLAMDIVCAFVLAVVVVVVPDGDDDSEVEFVADGDDEAALDCEAAAAAATDEKGRCGPVRASDRRDQVEEAECLSRW